MVSPDELARAVTVLRGGGLVAFPTETVYGLGCDAEAPTALRRLYAVKGRPPGHPVIVHLAEAAALDSWATDVPDSARVLVDACWPGPLTVVLRRSARVPDEVTGGRDTVGLRVPDQPVALALLHEFDGGIAAPSANRFGRVSPTTADHVRADLDGDVDLVLDGGPCRVGVESTIVDCSLADPVILRLGGVTRERVTEILGVPVELRVAGERAAPGTLDAHYAPDARVVLVEQATVVEAAEEMLGDGRTVGLLAAAVPGELPAGVVVLDPPADADEFARVLYARLREADRRELDVVLVVAPDATGAGAAVRDRLTRAATGSGR